jgi:hypothetical protein
MATTCGKDDPSENPGVLLGTTIGELARRGRDKLTFLISPSIQSFGDWVEQLIAESTGKNRAGILPVLGEQIGAPGTYGNDRVFVDLRIKGDNSDETAIAALIHAGHPVLRFDLHDTYDLAGQIFLWEFATAVAGRRLGVNPFDQPNVESAKVVARRMVSAYQESGALPESEPSLTTDDFSVYVDGPVSSVNDAFAAFLRNASPPAYIAIQAYVQSTDATENALTDLRRKLRDRTHCAVTSGYGPRFLHSTGQLHKGDAGQGLFIQITADATDDVAIPNQAGKSESSISFGVLIQAQAMGDRQALIDAGRRVIRFHLHRDVSGGLTQLIDSIQLP